MTASVARARLVVHGQVIDSTGHGQPAERAGAEVGYSPVDLVGVDDLAAVVAVAFGLVPQRGQRVELFVGPRDEQRAGALDRDAGRLGVVAEQGVPARARAGLQRARGRVEPGVQDRGVGLAGAVADVVAGLEQRHRQRRAGECAGDRGADDAAADDGDVCIVGAMRVAHHVREDRRGGRIHRADVLVRRGRRTTRVRTRVSGVHVPTARRR